MSDCVIIAIINFKFKTDNSLMAGRMGMKLVCG